MIVTQEKESKTILKPALITDIDKIHALLMEAIEDSPYYNDEFKQYEKNRLTKNYLLALHNEDPAHIMKMVDEGKTAGFMISGPELGTLWLYWSYLMPEHRKGLLAMSGMRAFIEHWDNGRFHKIATYTKDGNKAAEVIMKRAKYKHICTLENHIFGEDYHLYERPLTKVTKTYDKGLNVEGRFGRFKKRLKNYLTLAGRVN